MHTKVGIVFSPLKTLALAALAILLLGSAPAKADLIVAVGSVSALAGSTDQFVDVTLENTGSSSVTVGGFSFELSTSNTFVTFTAADTSTVDPYIFAGDSLFGPIISLIPPPDGQTVEASDLFDIFGSGVEVAAGSTVGLGELLFNVAADATSGTASLVLEDNGGGTSLSDENGDPISITTLDSGQITITGATTTVPEPSTFAPLVLLFMAIVCTRRLRTAAPLP